MASNLPNSVVTIFPPRAKALSAGAGMISDTTDLTDHNGDRQDMHIFVGVGGNVRVLPIGNLTSQQDLYSQGSVVFTIPSGGFVPVVCKRVLVAGTTASGLVGVW